MIIPGWKASAGIIGVTNLGLNVGGVSGGDVIVIPGIIGGDGGSCGSGTGGGGGTLLAACWILSHHVSVLVGFSALWIHGGGC